MVIKVDIGTYIVFDLDDTLFPEIEYLKSAFNSIALDIAPDIHRSIYEDMINCYLSGGNTFSLLIEKYPEKNLNVEKLLYLYRNHYPKITLREGVLEIITEIKIRSGKIGLITDGRSITQRNKLKALGIDRCFDRIVISEEFGYQKPDVSIFESFMKSEDNQKFYYIGDNISKDFVAPKKLGWNCIGIIDKDNIHANKISEVPNELLPHYFINKFTEIEII